MIQYAKRATPLDCGGPRDVWIDFEWRDKHERPPCVQRSRTRSEALRTLRLRAAKERDRALSRASQCSVMLRDKFAWILRLWWECVIEGTRYWLVAVHNYLVLRDNQHHECVAQRIKDHGSLRGCARYYATQRRYLEFRA